jgi:S-disulfanyl-L-cysteine oxidoreductase SoxD
VPLRPMKWVAAPVLVPLLAGSLIVTPSLAAGFTAEQAEAGEQAYNTNCAQCHGRQLEGPDAPGLAGQDVMQNWDSAGGLYDFISVAMPPSAPGQLGEENYLNIVAYIMEFNGAQPGDQPLTADPDVLYSVSLPEETAAGAASMAAAAADAGAPAAAAAPAAEPATSVAESAVPQAFTWGQQLPGAQAPAEAAAAPAATESAVPQAYTWGKDLPTAGAN